MRTEKQIWDDIEYYLDGPIEYIKEYIKELIQLKLKEFAEKIKNLAGDRLHPNDSFWFLQDLNKLLEEIE